jgi:superfamily II DNA or RNA helicase
MGAPEKIGYEEEDRQYQDDSIEGLRNGFIQKHKHQVLVLPTGGGKSVILKKMIDSARIKGSKVLFLVERRILAEQFSKHLDRAGIDHGILMSKHWRFRPQELVQVASIQTLEKMELFPSFDICFIDELHAAMRKSVVKLITSRPELKIVGATATPFHPAITKHFTNVVNVISMNDLVERGYLVPFKVFIAHEINTDGVKIVAGEFKKDELETRGRQIVGDVVADYIRLSNEVFGGYRKTICFSCGVAHGTELARAFNDHGINAVQISYKDTEEFKADVLAEFAKPDTDVKVVISTDILQRGFDQTDVEHVILAKPLKKSFSQHVQMVGRGARPHEGKSHCVIQDNAGNWLRFAEQWEELFHEGVKELTTGPDAKPKKEPTKREKELAKCPKCSMLWAGNSDICPHCGHVRPVVSNVSVLPGEMIEFTSGKKSKSKEFTAHDKQRWYSELLYLESTWNVKPNYAYALSTYVLTARILSIFSTTA